MTVFATPYPPTREAMVDPNGYVTDRWSAFFDSLFQTKNVIPAGVIWEYAGANAPVGWLFCDGHSYAIAEFPELFAVLGDTFGGDAVNFNVPDRRSRFAQGAVTSSEVGNTGGSEEFSITIDYLPNQSITITDPGHGHTFTPTPHNHGITDPGHTHTATSGGAGAGLLGAGLLAGPDITGNSATGITINNADADGDVGNSPTGITAVLPGGGQPFSLQPPYIKMNYIIKY